MKGALISFMPTFIGALPNVIVFQFNPETITHAWTPATRTAQSTGGSAKASHDPLAADSVPGESFAFKLILDSNEDLADVAANGVAAGLASVSGVYARLSAL